jgi:hypothetical protein
MSDTDASPVKRPAGISALAWIHIVTGTAFFGLAACISIYPAHAIDPIFETLGVTRVFALRAVALLGAVGLTSGIGMRRGRRWGWYLGSFFYLYLTALSVNAIRTTAGLPPVYAAKYALRGVTTLCGYLYFFKPSVLGHFGITVQARWKPVVGQLACGVAVAGVFVVSALTFDSRGRPEESLSGIGAPTLFKDESVEFLYPSNWTIRENRTRGDGIRVITILSPTQSDACVVVQVFPKGKSPRLSNFAGQVVGRLEDRYGMTPVDTSQHGTVSRFSEDTERCLSDFTLQTEGEPVLYRREFYKKRIRATSVFVCAWAPDSGYERSRPAFEQVVEKFKTAQ